MVYVTYQGDSYDEYSNEYTGNITIPETITYSRIVYSVKGISQNAFRDCSGLTSVTIPNSVTKIGTYAFNNCTGLTSVAIPNSVSSIGDHTFDNCTSLTSVTIPNSVTSIGLWAFYGCTNLTEITIPSSVTYIDTYAFYLTGWYNNQPDGVLYLDNCCVGYKRKVPASLSIREGTRLIAASAFFYCYVTEITIPNSVTHIGSNPFTNTFWFDNQPDGVLYIDNCCVGYKGAVIGDLIFNENTRLIADWAFHACDSLTSVTIPNSITSIGRRMFSACENLTSVTIPNSITSIDDNAFVNCWSLTEINIPNSVTSIGECAFAISGLTSVVIPNSVTSIGVGAFGDCSDLTSVTIGNSVKKIGDRAFDKCSNMKELRIEDGTLNLEIPELTFFLCDKLETLYLGRNLVYTGVGPFYEVFRSLKNVSIGNLVTNIADNMFSGCSGLTEINIPNSVTSIGKHAFSRCNSLTKITIGNSLTSIGDYAFKDCYYLEFIKVLNPIPPTCRGGYYTFDNYESSLVIPEGSLVAYRQADVWCNFTNITEVSGIEDVKVDATDIQELGRYDIDGRLLTEPTPGINIIKMSDGSTRKEWVK